MQHTTEETRRRWRFFHEHAGGIVGRQAVTALELARAEELYEEADELGAARFEIRPEEGWSLDDFPTLTAADFDENRVTGPYWCYLVAGRPAHEIGSASLGMVTFGPQDTADPYARVVRAELAAELVVDLRAAIVRAGALELAQELADRIGGAAGARIAADALHAVGVELLEAREADRTTQASS